MAMKKLRQNTNYEQFDIKQSPVSRSRAITH